MKFARFVYLSLFASSAAFAQDFQVVGKITQSIPAPRSAMKARLPQTNAPLPQKVTLWKVQLSETAKNSIVKRAPKAIAARSALKINEESPSQIQLGMNGVPVLNQGMHGTCATFANTAAIDAALKQGDYVSQLCQLELGTYLEHNGYNPSGWEGSSGRTILNQMDTFGIVSKEQQKASGCGGYTEYPIAESEPTEELSPADFHPISEPLNGRVYWSSLLDISEAFRDKTNTVKTLESVKAALRKQERVTFGVLLPDVHLGVAGAVGTHYASNDTWVLSTEIMRDLYQSEIQAGHEMIITGYDDDAMATDNLGNTHRGLFTLRNSWGERAGNKGDFYMSYDYFKTLVIEVQQIKVFDSVDEEEEAHV